MEIVGHEAKNANMVHKEDSRILASIAALEYFIDKDPEKAAELVTFSYHYGISKTNTNAPVAGSIDTSSLLDDDN